MNLCFLISDRIHRRRARRGVSQANARQKDDRAYWHWQYTTSASYFDKFFDLQTRLIGAQVIDIGCGLGGRTCFLAAQGVDRIVGTDINHAEIDRALLLANQVSDAQVRSRIEFRKVSEQEPQPEGEFDVALLVDSLEHVRDPAAMLNHAFTLLKPGGVCYFSTWGWYHHQASHVSSIVPIPFATLWFSDRQILSAVRRVVDQPYYQPTIWDSDPPSKRWRECRSLHDRPGEYLNKYTIAGFRRAMRASDFSAWELKVQGFSSDRHSILAAFNFLTRVPVIREAYHSAIFGKLTKSVSDRCSCQTAPTRRMRVSA